MGYHGERTGEVAIKLTLVDGKIERVQFEPQEYVTQIKELPPNLEGVRENSCMTLLTGVTPDSDCPCGYIYISFKGRLYKICIPCIKHP